MAAEAPRALKSVTGAGARGRDIYQSMSECGRGGELDFQLLAVVPAARRRGIGRLLAGHVIALAAERGATSGSGVRRLVAGGTVEAEVVA
jgi:GNAT superfamily N-acetyltransferase